MDAAPSASAAASRQPAAEDPRMSHESSLSSVSTTSLVFDRLHEQNEKSYSSSSQRRRAPSASRPAYADHPDDDDDNDYKESDANDLETGPFLAPTTGMMRRVGMDRGLKKGICILAAAFLLAWGGALFVFLSRKSYQHGSQVDHDPSATSRGSGKPVTLDQVMTGFWSPYSHSISWIEGPSGEDGLLLEQGARGKDYLVVEDVRAGKLDRQVSAEVVQSRTLMKNPWINVGGRQMTPYDGRPSKDMKKVLVSTDRKHNWRHSFTALYWIFDVETQTAEPLDPERSDARVQLATWSPQSNAIVFTRDNNLFLRKLDGDKKITQITKDGGPEYFYGIPDWVYEEEVFASNSATWYSEDGKYVAFLRTNETGVPEYPLQYFMSRPSGKEKPAGEETYPDEKRIKYPRAGSHNPVVDLLFYDVERGDVFTVDIEGGFADDDRLINMVLWANNKVLIKETNRVSDIMRVVLVDVVARTGKTVNTIDVGKIDGGWFEISHETQFIPADPANGRPDDGYVDTVIHDDGDHIAYFSPMDNPEPVYLTGGNWEVVNGPSAVDLANNLVYFVSTKESSIQRHVYSVHLNGSDLKPFTDTNFESYYDISFSSGAGFGLLSYLGPKIPWQKVISTPSNPTSYEHVVEQNTQLAENAKKYELPILKYGTIKVDDVELNYVERRPPHFNEKKKYPVLFQQYSGPGSQSVSKKFSVDFQSYIASALGYVVVTVDGRGTGYIGRKNRVLIREKLGHWEAIDQIAAAKHWSALQYVDSARIAIWGWSYGGFQTLKTLEMDAGQTFSYGMAVAPVTDWRFYDSIYTERYMRTPQLNSDGYDQTAISNVTALAGNVRWLMMHGVSDDNVHYQSTLTLLDKLNLEGVENYDVHVFPDSDHGIYFHNANKIVYDKLNNWLINAFNGEWLKVADVKPMIEPKEKEKRSSVAKLDNVPSS
ncbi:dipeptidyl peptidase IV N-terminal region-domain-containing protein [Colletotrichum phormii]|uniref:Probable dipeptidyl-aminopeptidase B n=1 Tax=Colletotrichum phormii TaxID=359342 RepID=A0AAJ0EA87_9PEZI|nr:dipeptidyl peptidase IV N-terminal region-domain-containing protein [Colletotrichum phormii]KAK1623640.1 dipeptidyl peptidase IV N-terminal region-domain-containing protein [Colletotrichum phormii]